MLPCCAVPLKVFLSLNLTVVMPIVFCTTRKTHCLFPCDFPFISLAWCWVWSYTPFEFKNTTVCAENISHHCEKCHRMIDKCLLYPAKMITHGKWKHYILPSNILLEVANVMLDTCVQVSERESINSTKLKCVSANSGVGRKTKKSLVTFSKIPQLRSKHSQTHSIHSLHTPMCSPPCSWCNFNHHRLSSRVFWVRKRSPERKCLNKKMLHKISAM